MNEDFDFDDSLIEAVTQAESLYFRNQGTAGQQAVAAAQQPAPQLQQQVQEPVQPPQQQVRHAAQQWQQQQRQQPTRQPVQLQPVPPAKQNIQAMWSMFTSKAPASASSGTCTGWAAKRLQPQHGASKDASMQKHELQQQQHYEQQQHLQQPLHAIHSLASCQQAGHGRQQQLDMQWQHSGSTMQHPSSWQPNMGGWGQAKQQLQQQAVQQQQQQLGNSHARQEQQQSWQTQQQQVTGGQFGASVLHNPNETTAAGQPEQTAGLERADAVAAQRQQPPASGQGRQFSVRAAPASTDSGQDGSGGAAADCDDCSSVKPAGQQTSTGTVAGAAGVGIPGSAAGANGMGPAAANRAEQPAATTGNGYGAAVGGGSGCSGAGSGCAAAGSGLAGSGSGRACTLYKATLNLGGQGMLQVSFSGPHPDIARVCSSLQNVKRDPGDRWGKSWLVPVDKVTELEEAVKNMPDNSVRVAPFEPLPDLVRNILTASRKQPDDSKLYQRLHSVELAAGETLEQRMMPFQREGVKFGLRAGGRVLIGDEMGLGKTVQACALAKCYQAEWPVLVVTPSSLRLSWGAALYDWLRVTEDRVLVVLKANDAGVLAHARSKEHARAMFDFIVVSYDMLKDLKDLLLELAFKMIILDESHCIKNSTAQRTKCSIPLLQSAQRAVLLSGTPALSRPNELLTQLQALLPKARITKAAFEDRYAEYNKYSQFKKVTGSKNEDELNKLLVSTVMIRRRKAEVLKDLPAKLRKQVMLMLPDKQRTELHRLKQQLLEVRRMTANMHGIGAEVGGGLFQGMEQQQRTMIMQLWHNTARIKADAVADYVKEMLSDCSDPDDKFLVFAYHTELMDAIERGVNSLKQKKEYKSLNYMRIDGQTKAEQRKANVDMFQEQEDCRVAILNIKAAGVGLTLTRASTVVFAELAWTPSEVQQAEDRAHRIGQTQCVSVQLLLVKDSIDELMWEMLQTKLATTGQVLDGHKDRMEVDRSNAPHPPRSTIADSSADNQTNITSFFAAKPEANKKQRVM